MRITFLVPNDLLTGGNRVVVNYASQLQARGHQVTVVSSPDAPTTLREHLRALRHGCWRSLQREKRARREPGHIALSGLPHRVLERCRPITAADVPDADVIVATWWETAAWMHTMPATKGRKVHLIQGYEIWWGGEEAKARVHATLRLPNRKIAISAGLKREIEDVLGNLDIHIVNNAVDGVLFDSPTRKRGVPLTVGFVYANDLIKAPDRCFKVIERLRQQIPELGVLAFGAQQPSAELPLPLGTQFHFRPPQEKIPALYALCDAWLFATRVDSFGLPLLEAMACRTPVVGVPVGAAPDLLAGGAGLIVAESDEEALCAALAGSLHSLISGPGERWQAMSDLAYSRAHAYTWQDAVCRFETLIAEPSIQPTSPFTEDRSWTSPHLLPA
jgi:glycosyltransferase involved in cell wall biosynthesis